MPTLVSSDLFARPAFTSTHARMTSPSGSKTREFEVTGVFPSGQSNVLGHFSAPSLPLQGPASANLRRYDPYRTTPPKDRTLPTYSIEIAKVEKIASPALFQEILPGVTMVHDYRQTLANAAHTPANYSITEGPWPLKGTAVFESRVQQPLPKHPQPSGSLCWLRWWPRLAWPFSA